MPLSFTLVFRELTPPPVAALDGNARVAGLAQGHEVAGFVSAAFGERKDVVYFLSCGKPVLAPALLAQWMQPDVSVAYPFPCTSISLVGDGVAFEPVVLSVCSLPVLSAELLAFSQPSAAGEGAGSFRFVWHRILLGAYEKPPQISLRWL
jgi:hypothetical protein